MIEKEDRVWVQFTIAEVGFHVLTEKNERVRRSRGDSENRETILFFAGIPYLFLPKKNANPYKTLQLARSS